MTLSIKKRNLSLEAQYRVKVYIPKAFEFNAGWNERKGTELGGGVGGAGVGMWPILKKKSLLILMYPFNIWSASI